MAKKSRYDASEWVDFALNLCRGSYQRSVVLGSSRLSGSDLRGKASKFAGKYSASRTAILDRMTKAGIPWSEIREKSGLRRLVIAGQVQ